MNLRPPGLTVGEADRLVRGAKAKGGKKVGGRAAAGADATIEAAERRASMARPSKVIVGESIRMSGVGAKGMAARKSFNLDLSSRPAPSHDGRNDPL